MCTAWHGMPVHGMHQMRAEDPQRLHAALGHRGDTSLSGTADLMRTQAYRGTMHCAVWQSICMMHDSTSPFWGRSMDVSLNVCAYQACSIAII